MANYFSATILEIDENVPDTEHTESSTANLSTFPPELLASLRRNWEKREDQANGKSIGPRIKIPAVFPGKGDLQEWKKNTANECRNAAYALGFSLKTSGPTLGWSMLVVDGSQVEHEGNPVFVLYCRTITKGTNKATESPEQVSAQVSA